MSCRKMRGVVVGLIAPMMAGLAFAAPVKDVRCSQERAKMAPQPGVAEVALVERGKAAARTVVIPQAASPVECHAAEELVSFLEQTTGVKLPGSIP